jgi:hypothetical protein
MEKVILIITLRAIFNSINRKENNCRFAQITARTAYLKIGFCLVGQRRKEYLCRVLLRFETRIGRVIDCLGLDLVLEHRHERLDSRIVGVKDRDDVIPAEEPHVFEIQKKAVG